MTSGKRNPPFGLDMPFGEALERYAGVIPSELAKPARSVPIAKGPKVLTWWKKLSKTDAQQETTGGLVPYLRLTKSSLDDENFQTWFREEFFAGAPFTPATFGKEDVELANIPFNVTVHDVKIGPEILTITHGADRQESHNTPNTWIHWSEKIQQILGLNDFTGKVVRLTRDDHGVYSLDIDVPSDADI